MKNIRLTQFLFFLLLLLLQTSTTRAQIWFPHGAVWHYGFDIPMGATGYYKLSIVGDTTINAQSCKIMQRESFWKFTFGPFTNTHHDILGNTYLYADANRVYMYHNQAFYTLYDFSAPIGASWQIPQNHDYQPCDTVGFVTVTDTGSMSINGQNLRYFKATPSAGSGWFFGTANQGATVTVIEKLGAVIGYNTYFLPASYDLCNTAIDDYGEGQETVFRCYSDSTGFFYQTMTDCEYITGIPTLCGDQSSIQIQQNSSTHAVKIASQISQPIQEVNIYSTAGANVLHLYPNIQEITLNLDPKLKGMYIVEATAANKTIRKKIIIL